MKFNIGDLVYRVFDPEPGNNNKYCYLGVVVVVAPISKGNIYLRVKIIYITSFFWV